MSLITFILVSSIISTAAFAIGERVAIRRRKIRRHLIIMGLTARLAERDEIARNNWN
jgi:hypothetical protein